MTEKIFVSGCFDMLHSGHVAFLKEASLLGNVYVGIGSDANVYNLKGRYPINNQDERKYMLSAVKYVHECVVNSGWGYLDFVDELKTIKPHIFMVNEDGNSPEKKQLCEELGIKYVVSRRIPEGELPARSTTSLRTICNIPYRIDLAGGWLDQPFVSEHASGSVLTISIEPTYEFNDRSGMSSSTRKVAIQLWKTDVPPGDKEQLAKTLFACENPPGKKEISGSQDSLGIVLPGLNNLHYDNAYWPHKIDSVYDESVLRFVENSLYLVPLEPRHSAYDVLGDSNITKENACMLANAANECWKAIIAKDLCKFGESFRKSFEAQVRLFPNTVDHKILSIIDEYKTKAYGWKLSGAGGGGYLILVADKEIEGTMKIKIKRPDEAVKV